MPDYRLRRRDLENSLTTSPSGKLVVGRELDEADWTAVAEVEPDVMKAYHQIMHWN